jgi:hypothetical protein
MNETAIQPRGEFAMQDSLSPEVPFQYSEERSVFDALWKQHQSGEASKCKVRRELRRHRVNVLAKRQKGELLPDETEIPDRTISDNIMREKPIYLNYVQGSVKVLTLSDPFQQQKDFGAIEEWITKLLRPTGWKKPGKLLIDSFLLHGAGFLEVLPDPNAVAGHSVDYIRRDHLILPPGTRSINSCQRIARMYELTKSQFKDFAKKFEFNPGVVTKILGQAKEQTHFIPIFKYFLRDDAGVVHIAWMASEDAAPETWLKDPFPYFSGLYDFQYGPMGNIIGSTPKVATTIPIFAFLYDREEDEVILETQGRASLDQHVQEAKTSAITSAVNGSHRASRFYPFKKNEDDPDPRTASTEQLKHGVLNKGDIGVFQPNWPNPILLSIAQVLSVGNAQSAGSVDFAAMSRQDTAKRATEINAATEQAVEIKSGKIDTFAEGWLDMHIYRFDILRNDLKRELSQPNGGKYANANDETGQQPLAVPSSLSEVNLFSPTLIVAVAADVEVIRRAEKEAKYLKFYPLFSGTKYHDAYFKTMISSLFPEEFPTWELEVGKLTAQEDALGRVMNMLMEIPPEVVNSSPQMAQMHAQLINEIPKLLPQPNTV